VSWHHAVLRLENGRWVLADSGSTNGTYAGDRRVDRIEIGGQCQVRLGHPSDGPVLSCTVSGDGPADEEATALPGTPVPQPEPIPPDREPGVARLSATTVRIGRAPENDIVVSDPTASREHAEIRNVAGGYRIVDLDSSHGTFVNGQRVTDAALSDGDVVRVGSSAFRLAGHELQEVSETSAEAGQAPPPAAVRGPSPPGPAPPPQENATGHRSTRPGAGSDWPVAAPPGGDGAPEIPYAIRWLVPKGERFASPTS
jgi:pSer/pThr/pTyr-binding forkhead associated (FHA) protein